MLILFLSVVTLTLLCFLFQDVFTFLDGIEAVSGVNKWELRSSFGNKRFCRQNDAKLTLEALEIAANTLFVVQEI